MVHGSVDVYWTNNRFERDFVKRCVLSSAPKQDVNLPRFYVHPNKGENCEIGGDYASKNPRWFIEEFKKEAVQLVRESARPVAQVARDLGIPDNVLYSWTAQHWNAETHDTTRVAQRAEVERLAHVKRGLARVTQERDMLRRAAVFIAKRAR